MHAEKGFEDLVLKGTTEDALKRFVALLDWPSHLTAKYPNPPADVFNALADYFSWSKGNWGIADFFAQCTEDEIPEWLRNACAKLKTACDPVPPLDDAAEPVGENDADPGASSDGAD